jgi:hypothetical protein
MSRGNGTALGWGLETTEGTAVSRTNWGNVYSASLQEVSAVEPVGTLYELGSSDVANDHVVSKSVSGSLELPLQYKGQGLWLALLFGDEPAPSGSDPDYTYTYDRAAAFAESATVEVIKGNSGRSEVFAGIKVNRGVIRVNPRDIVRLSLDLIGISAAARGAAGTPTFSGAVSAQAVRSRHAEEITSGLRAAEFSWNGANYTFNSLEIEINNNLSDSDDVSVDYSPASINQGGQGEITMRATLTYGGSSTDALRTGHSAGTESTFALTFAGVGNQALTLTGRNAKITGYTDPISGTGRIPATVTMRFKPDASNGALTLALTNGDAAYSTN